LIAPIRIAFPHCVTLAKQCGDCGGYMMFGVMGRWPGSNPDRIRDHYPACDQRGQWSPKATVRRRKLLPHSVKSQPCAKQFASGLADEAWVVRYLRLRYISKIPASTVSFYTE
jgi:hypothetical protein